MRVRLLSRSSDLARLQTKFVQNALLTARPGLDVHLVTRSSLGDRDKRIDLWQTPDKGLFTSDLSAALVDGDADIAVHSWKDLPSAGYAGTVVAGTLPRADPRDVLLLRRQVLTVRPEAPEVLTSSPRRTCQLQQNLSGLLPWHISGVRPKSVRGNIPTRLAQLVSGQADGLVVAKAALDRLLSPASEPDVRQRVRAMLSQLVWMVLPLRAFPTAPAQGALALEVSAARPDLRALVEEVSDPVTRRAVEAERALLAAHGGGCHEAIGVTVLVRDYGVVTSMRGRASDGQEFDHWSLDPTTPLPPPPEPGAFWPRPGERDRSTRRALDVHVPDDGLGWWVARADAVPVALRPSASQLVWAAGVRTWRRLAARGIWVHGCSDGLGDGESPDIDALADRTVRWRRLTHTRSRAADAFATYEVDTPLPADLAARTHFFWTSGSLMLDALERFPQIARGWHACGPGHTSRVVGDAIGDPARVSIWLDYEQWLQHVNR